MQMIFFIEIIKIHMAKIFFPYFSLNFSKKSLISLTFSYPLKISMNFPDFLDFPDRVEILSEHEDS